METTFDPTYATTVDSGALAAIMAFLGTFFLVILAIAVFMVVCYWKIFVKAGKPGWAAIIPFYNTYVLVEIVGRPVWFFWAMVACAVLGAVPFVNVIASLGAMVLGIFLSIDLAKAFGKDTGFAVLLIFLPVVGLPMLAFGSATYNGPVVQVAPTPAAPPATPEV